MISYHVLKFKLYQLLRLFCLVYTTLTKSDSLGLLLKLSSMRFFSSFLPFLFLLFFSKIFSLLLLYFGWKKLKNSMRKVFLCSFSLCYVVVFWAQYSL